MATKFEEPKGSGLWVVQYVDGKLRPKIRLGYLGTGRAAENKAEGFKVRLEDLLNAKQAGFAPSKITLEWLSGLGDAMKQRLAELGLIVVQRDYRLGDWLEECVQSREGRLKPASVGRLKDTKRLLLEFLDASKPLSLLTPDDAAGWERWMKDNGLSEATRKTMAGNAKTFFNEAVDRELIARNPFRHLKSGVTAREDNRYITPDDIDRVIDACPNNEWALWFGLARYAGLRIPSESHLLTWASVRLDEGELIVKSPKTERHPGKGMRIVPIDPRLRPLLQDRFDVMGTGERPLVAITGQGGIERRINSILARAGVERWPAFWQTLRASRDKEWQMEGHPAFAVDYWMGHTRGVSATNYTNGKPPVELFRKANGMAGQPEQNPEQTVPENGGEIRKEKTAPDQAEGCTSGICRDLPQSSVSPCEIKTWRPP